MKKLMFALAGAALTSFAAESGLTLRTGDIDATGFEGFAAEAGVAEKNDNGTTGGTVLWYSSGTDESLVKAYGGEGNLADTYSGTFPDLFQGAGDNYLALDTSGNVLTRYFQQPTVDSSGETPVITPDPVTIDTTVYIDTMVQFTPSETEPTSEELAGAKLAIWLGIDTTATPNTTNLYVKGNAYDMDGEIAATPTSFVLVPATGTLTIQPGTWYRLTVKAIENVFAAGSGYGLPAFQVFVNDREMVATTAPVSSALQTVMTSSNYFANDDIKTAIGLNKIIPTLAAMGSDEDTVTLAQVDFKGSGAIDDFLVTTVLPGFLTPAVDFTLTWPSGYTAVSYTIGADTTSLSGLSSPQTIQVQPGVAVALKVADVNGVEKTISATQSSEVNGIDATGTTFTWADYLGDAVNGAYEIDDLAELIKFQKGVATNEASANASYLATAGLTFKLTADVALTDPWPGIGVQNGKDIAKTDDNAQLASFAAAAFQGTFDGQNNTISGFQMEGGNLDYAGFFNSVYGATIQNLKIAYKPGENGGHSLFAVDTTSSSTESGATFVGTSAGNATLRNLTSLAGTLDSGKGIGGIAGWTRDTTIDSCTNNLNLTSLKGNKAGGIVMVTQKSAVTLRNCVNNGTTAGNATQKGGMVAYLATATTIDGCTDTAGTPSFVAAPSAGSVTTLGVNTAPAGVVSYELAEGRSEAIDDLAFATVAQNVATFVKAADLALSGSYKVMGPKASYAFASAGSITFDQSLATPTVTADGFTLTTNIVGNVYTYTAASSGSTVHPGENDGETYTSEADALAAADDVTIEASDAVANALGSEATATYEGRFEAQAVEISDGVWNVVVGLKATEEAALQTQADGDAGAIVAALDGNTVTVNTTPGFYYSVKYGSALDAINYQTAGELATGNTKAITLPAKSGNAGFYKIVISILPTEAVAPQN